MVYTRKKEGRDPDGLLHDSLEPIIRGLGISLVELNVFTHKGKGGSAGSVQVRVIVYRHGNTGVDDCSKVHRALLPRLELTFPGKDIYLEVSSPGIDRIIKDGTEFVHFIGREVQCFRTDISAWTAGVLCAADEEKIVLKDDEGEIILPYEAIAKARLSGDGNKK